ncbi:MAG: T9SS type A sorting domain-containing protein, partial [Bacteroidetes bacterium]|nr:T9SS type A sorting domain-containing protein [Bacteroidota bacterium]
NNGIEATINWNNQFIGVAEVEVAAVNVCGQSEWSQKSEIVVRSTVGVNEQNLQNLRIYPNPSNGRIILAIDQLKAQSVTIRVNNIIGELVYSETTEANAGKLSREIGLEHLPDGVYMITVENAKSIAVQRITIRK